MKKIGLIQTRGIGDLIIALPIAHYYHERGYLVCWPIDSRFVPFMTFTAPYVQFIPIDYNKLSSNQLEDYFLEVPRKLLLEQGCIDIKVLYNVAGGKLIESKLGGSLKFDEYKYAICNVPFREKWNLNITRNMDRELNLYKALNIKGEYVCIHRKSGNFVCDATVPKDWVKRYRIIEIEEITDNPFDWIYTLENASKLMLLDSCFANLVEQLNMTVEKYLIIRSVIHITPVYLNGWNFI